MAPRPASVAVATFAGGCFWCMEPPYDKLPGVSATISGYIGGKKANPTYQEVSTGTTGHTEVVQVVYDPKKVSYERLLEQARGVRLGAHGRGLLARQPGHVAEQEHLAVGTAVAARGASPSPRSPPHAQVPVPSPSSGTSSP